MKPDVRNDWHPPGWRKHGFDSDSHGVILCFANEGHWQ